MFAFAPGGARGSSGSAAQFIIGSSSSAAGIRRQLVGWLGKLLAAPAQRLRNRETRTLCGPTGRYRLGWIAPLLPPAAGAARIEDSRSAEVSNPRSSMMRWGRVINISEHPLGNIRNGDLMLNVDSRTIPPTRHSADKTLIVGADCDKIRRHGKQVSS